MFYDVFALALFIFGVVLIRGKSRLLGNGNGTQNGTQNGTEGKKGQSTLRRTFDDWVLGATLISGISRIELLAEFIAKVSLIPVAVLVLGITMSFSLLQSTLLIVASFVILMQREFSRKTKNIKKYREMIESEFSSFAETLAIAVNSGLSFMISLTRTIDDFLDQRRTEITDGLVSKITTRIVGRKTPATLRLTPLQRELQLIRIQIFEGRSISEALDEFSRRLNSQMISDFVDAIVLSLSRGAPIAFLITDHANSIRESERRNILERAGKAEIKMMVPVVFLLLPISVLFALWPSFQQLQQMVTF